MTTVINTPGASNDNSSSGFSAIVITILILGTLFAVFYFYVLPLLRNNGQQNKTPSTNINVQIPTPQVAPSPAPQQ